MPHEDRCILAGLVLDHIHEDTTIQLSSMVVASWREVPCNSFFLLANTQPSSRLQAMVPPGQKITLEAAAASVAQTWHALQPDKDARHQQAA